MINDKKELTLDILKESVLARKDSGVFLNIAYRWFCFNNGLNPILAPDFTIFKVESFLRCWRKVLEEHPELDEREDKNQAAESQVRSELGYAS